MVHVEILREVLRIEEGADEAPVCRAATRDERRTYVLLVGHRQVKPSIVLHHSLQEPLQVVAQCGKCAMHCSQLVLRGVVRVVWRVGSVQ